ncbi:MAG TPA: hypothetical protein VMR70_18270 [Flavisolibacter sp.]|nr:hypothetical protein [Flavisolibacter sp.]
MKIRKIKILTAFVLGAVLLFTGCSKDDGPIKKKVEIEDVPVVTTNIDATGSQAIDLLNIGSFQGKFKVAMYFPDAVQPEKVDIVVRKNGSAGNVKLFKANVTTFPTSYTINAAEIAALFGTPIALGDTYDFAPDLYVGDKKYQAFPATGSGTGAGVNGMPGFGEFARFAAICAYDPSIYQGNFVVVQDDWADYNVGDVVVLTRVSNNQFSFRYKADGPQPIVVTVNTGNNVTSVAKQVFGSGYGASWTYGPISVASVSNAANIVAPCDKTLGLALTFTVSAGTFSPNPAILKLRKQ